MCVRDTFLDKEFYLLFGKEFWFWITLFLETCNFDSKYVFSCRCIFSYARVCILREGNNGDIYTIWLLPVRVCEGIVVCVEPYSKGDTAVYVFMYYVFCRNDILSLTASPAKPGSSFALLLSVASLYRLYLLQLARQLSLAGTPPA